MSLQWSGLSSLQGGEFFSFVSVVVWSKEQNEDFHSLCAVKCLQIVTQVSRDFSGRSLVDLLKIYPLFLVARKSPNVSLDLWSLQDPSLELVERASNSLPMSSLVNVGPSHKLLRSFPNLLYILHKKYPNSSWRLGYSKYFSFQHFCQNFLKLFIFYVVLRIYKDFPIDIW